MDGRLEAENITFTKIVRNERLERKLIDKAALREALLNALLHNDYANGPAPKVEFFSDRVEIISYGGLPYGISEEDFYQGRSYPRNVELMRVFRDLDIVEQLGSGVPRILKAYGKEAFHISENYLTVVLPFSHGFDEGEDTVSHGFGRDGIDDKILDLISENPSITRAELAKELAVSLSTVQRCLTMLKKKGIIGRYGGKFGGGWEVDKP